MSFKLFDFLITLPVVTWCLNTFDQPESGESKENSPAAKNTSYGYDLRVVAGDTAFTCRSDLMCASSEFFKALLNIEMKERISRQVVLHTINPDTFHDILNFITTGSPTLTNVNVTEVWKAADFLQIPALLESSQTFLAANISLENWKEAYDLAELLASNFVRAGVFQFALRNFEAVWRDEKCLKLSYAEVMEIISSEELTVKNEDLVLSFILRWVSYSENTNSDYQYVLNENGSDLTSPTFKEDGSSQTEDERNRIVHLLPLIKASRYYLVSEEYLNHLLSNNHLFKENSDVSGLMFKALAHKNDHGYYPSPAQHRRSSDIVHAAIVVLEEAGLKAFSLRDYKWYDLPLCHDIEYVDAITVFGNELFILGNSLVDDQSMLLVLRNNNWHRVLNVPLLNCVHLLSHGSFIYAFDCFDGKLYCIDPRNPSLHVSSLNVSVEQELQHVMSFGDEILLFFSGSDLDVVTCVYGFDVNSNQYVRYEDIDGPAEYIVSFRSDYSHYVLQRNGTFSKVTKTFGEMPVFTVQHNRMPDSAVDSNEMCGCFVYKDTFYVQDDQLNWDVGYTAIPGIFSKAVHLPVRDCAMCFAHCDLPAEVLAVQSTCAVLI